MFFFATVPTPALVPVTPTDGMVISADTTFEPGTYVFKKGVTIAADNVTLDGNGATLVGWDDTGKAVSLDGHKGVTIKNLKVERFRWGIYAKNADGIHIQGCGIHRTWEYPPGDTFLDVWTKPEDAYGSAIMIWKAKNGVIEGNDLQHQQNGLLLYECSNMKVTKNNASFNSGFGISLYSTSDCVVADNVADFCIRIHERGPKQYQAGADATGILIIVNSCRNKIQRNYFRGGGDGVFVAGFHAPDFKAPCNDNLFEDNDCSLSPNNAFELTFCEGNVFRGNRANNCNFGFWLGYSWKNTVEDNDIRNNRIAGIAIEHGNTSKIEKNRITTNQSGILLWSDGNAGLATYFPKMQDSFEYTITGNEFDRNTIGINCITGNGWWGQDPIKGMKACRDYTVTGNNFKGNRTGVRFIGVKDSKIAGNEFDAKHEKTIDVTEGEGITQSDNKVAAKDAGG